MNYGGHEMRVNVLGIQFDNLNISDAVEQCIRYLDQKLKAYIVTPNAEIVYDALHDPELAGIINSADLVLPDGIGVIKASNYYGTPIQERIAGVDFGLALCERLQNSPYSLFLFGAKPGIAEDAAKKLIERFPSLKICGTQNGYYDNEEKTLDAIRSAKPDLIFVCLGAPKQEKLIAKYIQSFDHVVMIGLGGSLDVYAGAVKRAPKVFIKLGLEWFYRLIIQPTRIKRILKLPKFLYAAKKESKKERG